MKRNRLKIALLGPLYTVQAAIVLPLLWMSSLSFRQFVHRERRLATRRSMWTCLRILGKHGAMELGFMLPVAMAVPATIAAGILQTPAAFFGGAVAGFVSLTLLPVVMRMPSTEMDDVLAAGKRLG